MGRLLRSYDKDYMRMEMLKHEETFKEQVYELHRLYRIQKTLMKSMESNNSMQHGNFMHQNNSRKILDLEVPAEEMLNNNVGGDRRMLEVIDESEIELTLGPTSYGHRKNKHGTPRTSDSGPSSFSSSSTESSHMNRRSSVSKLKMNMTRAEQLRLGFQSGSKNNVDLEEQLRQEQERLKQPPWLFQVLSMNMT